MMRLKTIFPRLSSLCRCCSRYFFTFSFIHVLCILYTNGCDKRRRKKLNNMLHRNDNVIVHSMAICAHINHGQWDKCKNKWNKNVVVWVEYICSQQITECAQVHMGMKWVFESKQSQTTRLSLPEIIRIVVIAIFHFVNNCHCLTIFRWAGWYK